MSLLSKSYAIREQRQDHSERYWSRLLDHHSHPNPHNIRVSKGKFMPFTIRDQEEKMTRKKGKKIEENALMFFLEIERC